MTERPHKMAGKANARPTLAEERAHGSGRTQSSISENGYPREALDAFCAAWAVLWVAILAMMAVA